MTLLTLTWLACSPSPSDTQAADTAPETDADTDADSDSDTDSDADSDPVTTWDPEDFSTVWTVGPEHTYAELDEVPWEALTADTLVQIHWREAPYLGKFVVTAAGSPDAPIVITGVPQDGQLPVISGQDAVTRQALDYWNEGRSVIKIGGASTPSGTPAYVTIAHLDIRSARPGYSFTDDRGERAEYSSNGASVHIEAGDHITVLGCTLHDSGNGLFVGNDASEVLVYGNHLHGNGIEGSVYEHNSYTEALGITFEANLYEPLRAECLGNNLKDRSAGTVIRYNHIVGGNRALDLVESDRDLLTEDPRYHETFVYGNVFIELDDGGNSQVLHYGGDGSGVYRGGTLHLYNNTIVSERPGNTTLLRLSSESEHADLRNNVVVAPKLAILNGSGSAELQDNWLSEGWSDAFSGDGTVQDSGNLSGTDPALDADYRPSAGSPLLGGAGSPHPDTSAHPVDREYSDQSTTPRPTSEDIGAFEG